MPSTERQRLVFFDLETGGLDPKTHPIIQFAARSVFSDTFEPAGELEIKIRFDPAGCEHGALVVNRYFERAEEWKHAETDREAVESIASFLRLHSTVPMVSKAGRPYRLAKLCGHNAAAFDFPFLREFFSIRGAFLPAAFSVLDSLQLARWIFHERSLAGHPEPASNRLEDLASALGVEIENAHDALSDVRTTAEVTRRLLAMLSLGSAHASE